jgi:CheY-like chemotaxis protein
MQNQRNKLLLVDDEASIRRVLSAVLTELGHEVRSAEDGFAALQEMHGWMPDILLSDLNMPGMSGFELLSVVRRRMPWIYVIATSGAYSGVMVPHGVAADSFYEKATGMRPLLDLLAAARAMEEIPVRTNGATAPIWICRAASEYGSGPQQVINCPQCLRNSTQSCADTPQTIHRTECLYCKASIYYAMIGPMDKKSSKANQPGLAAGRAAA